MRFLQNHPQVLESIYLLSLKILGLFRSRLKPGSRFERFLIPAERLTKGAVFDCRMCGQCVLHSTGMTCPMTCPKNLRNGPCGGVRPNGHCEVVPEMPCVWVQAWERSGKMPRFGSEILHVLPPLSYDREGSSAWVNHFSEGAKAGPHWKQ